MASSSLLVGTTTGSGCDYWQTTSYISTAAGSNTCVSECVINPPFYGHSAHFHQWAKSEFMKAGFIFALCFCLLLWGCGACVTQSMLEGSWRGIWKKHTECNSNLRSHKPLDPFGILVCTLWHRHAHIIHTHWDTSHKQTWAHTPQPKKQHMHRTGSGATTERCCFNGSDLLLLRPVWKSWAAASAAASSHWMNPVPWQRVTWSSGLWATACLPARLPCCQCSFQSFIFLAPGPGATSFNANQCHAAKMPHTEPVTGPERTVPCVYGRKQKIRPTSPHYFLHHRSIDTSLFLLHFLQQFG